MSKPILVISLGNAFDSEVAYFTNEQLEKRIDDWHILAISSGNEQTTFHAFSDQNATEIDLEQLRKPLIELSKQIDASRKTTI